MKKMLDIRFYTITAWVGVALMVGVVVFMRNFSVAQISTNRTSNGTIPGVAENQNVPNNEPLGELHSHCGGALRLPCRPGLSCSVQPNITQLLGTCIKE